MAPAALWAHVIGPAKKRVKNFGARIKLNPPSAWWISSLCSPEVERTQKHGTPHRGGPVVDS